MSYYNNPKLLETEMNREIPDIPLTPPSLFAFAGHAFLGALLQFKSRNAFWKTVGQLSYALALVSLVKYVQVSRQSSDSGKGI